MEHETGNADREPCRRRDKGLVYTAGEDLGVPYSRGGDCRKDLNHPNDGTQQPQKRRRRGNGA